MEYKTITIAQCRGYAVVTMNRPREMNALSDEMRRELYHVFKMLENDDQIRSIVLTGGEFVFSAGMDIKEMSSLADEEIDSYFLSITAYLKKIFTFKKPVVAAVGGIALGGGFNLAVVCDMIIASESAIFGHPELKFGLNPLFHPLAQLVGMAKAKEITMLGEPIGAKEALRIGLVNKVSPPECFMADALVMAEELTKRSPEALAAVKRLSDIVPRLEKAAALDLELGTSALLFSRPERKARMNEFIMKEFLHKMKRREKDSCS
jgi:enoyl-CoA hydratase/carnithine racemase